MQDLQHVSLTVNGAMIPQPGVYTLDPVHTFTDFVAQHQVVGHVRGRFDRTTGTVIIADDVTRSTVEVSVDTASISTHETRRDEDLRSQRFFDIERFPSMTFRSVRIVPELDGCWTVEGELTIRDTTRHVPLTARITGIREDRTGHLRVGLEAQGRINRREFVLLADLEPENGGMPLGADVVISVIAEALRQG